MKKITYNIFTVIFIAILFTQCNTPKHTMSVAQIPPVAPKPTIKVADSTQYIIVPTKPQPILLTDPKDNFEQSYQELKAMLQDTQTADFERAVFLSENPYHNSKYTYEQFQQIVDAQLTIIEKLIAVNDKSDTMNFDAYVGANGKFKMADMRFLPKEKKVLYQKALSNWAIFTYLTDTLTIQIKDSNNLFTFYHPPFTYVSNDPFGKKDWSNTQVISLLFSEQQKGNCFSLTALFKILANRLGSDARICTAPQHSYIQHKDNKGDYYNIELATAGFPRDGTIQTLTHTTSTAIKSGIALRDYTEKESIGLCLVNLAKSYEHYYETKDDDFLLKCAEVVLQTDSFNLSALLLKQQVLDERVTKYALSNTINSISKLQQDKNIQQTVTDLQIHLQLLYRLGYRQMPIDMQQIIMSGIYPENGFEDKNASPFTTIKPKDVESITYQSLSGGLFQEVYDTKPTELYGHFVFDTKTKQLKTIDTKAQDNFLIDPVAFAYDFGARMYDERLGRFTSTDPLQNKYPSSSPYSFAGNTPIQAIDVNGEELYIVSTDPSFVTKSFKDIQKITNDKLILLKSGQIVTEKQYQSKASFFNFLGIPAPTIAQQGTPSTDKNLQAGTYLIDEITKHKNKVNLNEQPVAGGGNSANAVDKIGAGTKGLPVVDALNALGTGIGSDVNVYIDYSQQSITDRNKRIMNADGTAGAPPMHISIAHEFLHALRALTGSMTDQINYNYVDIDKYVKPEITNEEITVRKYENVIRKEQGVKQRASPKKVN